MPEEKVKEGEVSTKFYNFLAKQISRKSDYYWRFYSNFLVNTNKANISEKINLKLVGRKSLWRRGGNKFLFCPTKKNFRPIGAFLTILEALSCKTKYRKYLAKYPFPGIHICVTYFQYCNNEPDIPKSSIKQLWNLDPRYTSISPRSGIESYVTFVEGSWQALHTPLPVGKTVVRFGHSKMGKASRETVSSGGGLTVKLWVAVGHIWGLSQRETPCRVGYLVALWCRNHPW